MKPAHPTTRTVHLSTFLSLLLVATTAVTFALIGGLVLAYRIPVIGSEARETVQREAIDKAQLLEFALNGLEYQLEPIAALAQYASASTIDGTLQAMTGRGTHLLAIYVVSPDGIVRSGSFANTQSSRAANAANAVGSDLSRNPLLSRPRTGKRSGATNICRRKAAILSLASRCVRGAGRSSEKFRRNICARASTRWSVEEVISCS